MGGRSSATGGFGAARGASSSVASLLRGTLCCAGDADVEKLCQDKYTLVTVQLFFLFQNAGSLSWHIISQLLPLTSCREFRLLHHLDFTRPLSKATQNFPNLQKRCRNGNQFLKNAGIEALCSMGLQHQQGTHPSPKPTVRDVPTGTEGWARVKAALCLACHRKETLLHRVFCNSCRKKL